jgi:hypothetical protein
MDTVTGVGYYIPQLVPEPDSVLTSRWGQAIANGIKRIFCGGTKIGTLSSSANPFIFQFPNVTLYEKMPFVKIYTHAGSGLGRAYSDYFSQGSSSADWAWVNMTFVDKASPFTADKATVNFSTYIPGAEGFTIIAHGR